jgi:hypothetical protein
LNLHNALDEVRVVSFSQPIRRIPAPRSAQSHAVEPPLLHKRVTGFEQHGNLEEAFKHGLATGDMDWASA